jgi:hypothetical protein
LQTVFVGVVDDNRDKIKDQRGQLKSKWYVGGEKEELVKTAEVLIWSPPCAGSCRRARNVIAFLFSTELAPVGCELS